MFYVIFLFLFILFCFVCSVLFYFVLVWFYWFCSVLFCLFCLVWFCNNHTSFVQFLLISLSINFFLLLLFCLLFVTFFIIFLTYNFITIIVFIIIIFFIIIFVLTMKTWSPPDPFLLRFFKLLPNTYHLKSPELSIFPFPIPFLDNREGYWSTQSNTKFSSKRKV